MSCILFPFNMPSQLLLHSNIELSKRWHVTVWHFSALWTIFLFCNTCWASSGVFMAFSSNLVQFIFPLLSSTPLQVAHALLVSVGGHSGLVSLLSDWQTDKPSCLGPVGCRWTQIAGPWWMAADSGLTATAGRLSHCCRWRIILEVTAGVWICVSMHLCWLVEFYQTRVGMALAIA